MADITLADGVIGAGVAILSFLGKREFSRIDENFKKLFQKMEELPEKYLSKTEYDKRHDELSDEVETKMPKDLCKERRDTCDPCRKAMTGVIETQDEIMGCVNKHVDSCDVKRRR